ncbi:hypothetical protein KEM54_000043 [Ascosphaera aggregata]|nr:hypothetical protein KEM54_000043 [Ascosphaera aggregata]
MVHLNGLYEGYSTAGTPSSLSVTPYPTNSPPPLQAPFVTLHSSLPSLDSDHSLSAQPSSSSSSLSLSQSDLPELTSRSIANHADLADAAAKTLSARESGDSFAVESGIVQALQSVAGCPNPSNLDFGQADLSDLHTSDDKAMTAALETSAAYALSEVQREMSRMANEEAARRAKVDRQLRIRNMQLLREKQVGPPSFQPQASRPSTDIREVDARLQESLRRVGELEGYVSSLQEELDAAHRLIRDRMTERESLREENRALKRRIVDNRSHISLLLSGNRSVTSQSRQLSSQTSISQSTTYPPSSHSISQRSVSDYEGLDIILAAANSSDNRDLSSNPFHNSQQRQFQTSQESATSSDVFIDPQQGHPQNDSSLSAHQPKLYMYPPPLQNSCQSKYSQTSTGAHQHDDATIVGSGSSDDETVEHGLESADHSRTSQTIETGSESWSRRRGSECPQRRYRQSTLYRYSRVNKAAVSGRKRMMHKR